MLPLIRSDHSPARYRRGPEARSAITDSVNTTSVRWEVYGDWDDDPSKVQTDVYWLLG